MANYVYIATSLDGFIAESDGGTDWLSEIPNPDQSDYGYAEFMRGIDAVLMGRNTYEKVLTFGRWPYAKPVFVLTQRLRELPEDIGGKAQIVRGCIEGILDQLNQKGYANLYIDGGETIQSFLEEDRIDEMIITRVPILLGNGIPLFGVLSHRMMFIHQKTEIYNNALVKTHYKRER